MDSKKERVSIFSHLSDEEFFILHEFKARQIFGSQIRAEEALYRICFPQVKIIKNSIIIKTRIMKTEELITKGVEKHFNGQEVLFKVESLKEHFDGLSMFETDIIELTMPVIGSEEDFVTVQFLKLRDIDFTNAVAKEVAPEVEKTDEVVLEDNELDLEGMQGLSGTSGGDGIQGIADETPDKK